MLWLGVVILVVIALASLPTVPPKMPSSPNGAPIVTALPDIPPASWEKRGQLVSQESYNPPDDDLDGVMDEAWKATYLSVSGVDGDIREVSGAFFIPRGKPPEGGWPVISFGHGTTGVGNDCGPTRQRAFQGYLPIVEQLLGLDYAVALSDYEGLGPTGVHPYLEPNTAAFNITDAVRALRSLTPSVSSRWVAIGYSQGGQASWAANELDAFYGQDLQLLGSIALAPAANVSGVAELAWDGSLTDQQLGIYPMLITGLSRFDAGIDPQAFLHGSLAQQPSAFTRCEPPTEGPQSTAPAPTLWQSVVEWFAGNSETKPDTTTDVDDLRTALREIALPQRRLTSPMLVVTGRLDTLILAEWVVSSVVESCALGGQITLIELPSADHQNVMGQAAPDISRWLAGRFGGAVAPSNCPLS